MTEQCSWSYSLVKSIGKKNGKYSNNFNNKAIFIKGQLSFTDADYSIYLLAAALSLLENLPLYRGRRQDTDEQNCSCHPGEIK